MKTILGIALGFSLMPATIGLIASFAWASIYFKVDRSDIMLGVVLGLATFVGGVAIATKVMLR